MTYIVEWVETTTHLTVVEADTYAQAHDRWIERAVVSDTPFANGPRITDIREAR